MQKVLQLPAISTTAPSGVVDTVMDFDAGLRCCPNVLSSHSTSTHPPPQSWHLPLTGRYARYMVSSVMPFSLDLSGPWSSQMDWLWLPDQESGLSAVECWWHRELQLLLNHQCMSKSVALVMNSSILLRVCFMSPLWMPAVAWSRFNFRVRGKVACRNLNALFFTPSNLYFTYPSGK